MKLYLDDIRTSPMEETWVTVQSFVDAIMILTTCWDAIDEVSLDHDLGTQKTGYDVLCVIEETCRIKGNLPFDIYVHSVNPVGREKMEKVIRTLIRTYKEKTCK